MPKLTNTTRRSRRLATTPVEERPADVQDEPVVATLAVEAPEPQPEPELHPDTRRSVISRAWKATYAKTYDSNGDGIAMALRDATQTDTGKCDLAALHALYRANGVDPSRWEHLNPGMQRMNGGNVLRGLSKHQSVVIDGVEYGTPAE